MALQKCPQHVAQFRWTPCTAVCVYIHCVVSFITTFFSVFRFSSHPQDKQAGRFLVGVSIEQAVSVSPEGMDEGPPDSPPLSEEGSGKGSRGGSLRRPSRRWTGRYGMAWNTMKFYRMVL